jgi:hypothetical protein
MVISESQEALPSSSTRLVDPAHARGVTGDPESATTQFWPCMAMEVAVLSTVVKVTIVKRTGCDTQPCN